MRSASFSSSFAARGKFFVHNARKFFFKAARLDASGDLGSFEQKLRLRARLDDLKAASTTGLIVNGPQAESMLDLAAQAGLGAMLEIELAPDDLLTARSRSTIAARLARTAQAFSHHPALLGYLLDCPVGADWLRMHGVSRIQRRLRELVVLIKRQDSEHLVAIRHRPPTRALISLEEDLIYSTVPALSLTELKNYIVSLHNIAETRPVIVEFAEASSEQDERISCAFAVGAAGVVAPACHCQAHPGLLDAQPLSAELLPFLALNGTCPPALAKPPMVSVVICAYNAERTMRQCMDSLRALAYPNFEVIVVDDGSRDRTAEIAAEFPEFRLIRQPNKGLSVARNVGLHAARGEIIAYTDSDCVVDPHWLTLLVAAMVENNFDGCGGPNYAPEEDSRVAACVAVSPGAPCHVLTAEDRAEHLAGCNMAFRKSALVHLGGFDPQFTAAGDDVDICWRALNSGFTLGFSPAAFVWHFRRNTIKAYFGQQRGYGKAEAMLYRKYPERFNVLGQVMWRGTIPGVARTLPGGRRKRIFWGQRARGYFQSIYEPEQGLLKFLPQTLEWQLLWTVTIAAAVLAGCSVLPGFAMLALGPFWALYYAWQVQIQKSHDSLSSRLLVAALSYLGPPARALTRYRYRLLYGWSARAEVEHAPRQLPALDLRSQGFRLNYWNLSGVTRDRMLDRLTRLFAKTAHPVVTDSGWNDFDLEVRPDAWTRVEIKTADEEHGGGRLKNLVLARVRLSPFAYAPIAACALGAALTAILGWSSLALLLAAIAAVAAAFAAAEVFESAELAYRAIESCGAELGLIPLGAPTSAARLAALAVDQSVGAPAQKPLGAIDLIGDKRPVAE